jgi:hypothetical protein
VTLLLGFIKADGIYVSADYRVTNVRTGALIDDASVKFLTVVYPPDKTGPRALIGFSGLARLRDGTPVGTWIRETLRGESEVIDVSMAHLGARLDRDVAPLRVGLIINVLVLEPGRRLYGAFTNMRRDGTILDAFQYVMRLADKPGYFADGSGADRVLMDQKTRALLQSQLRVKPRQPMDHMRLLATVNRRIAARDKSVSPFCHVSFIPSQGEGSLSHVFIEKGESVPFEMPVLLFGIDLTGTARRLEESFAAMRRGETAPPMDEAAMNEELKRRP